MFQEGSTRGCGTHLPSWWSLLRHNWLIMIITWSGTLSSVATARVLQPRRIFCPFANDAEPFITTNASTSLANALYSVVSPGRLLSTSVVLETFSQAPTSRGSALRGAGCEESDAAGTQTRATITALFLVSLIHCSESANLRPVRKAVNRYFQLLCAGVVDSADENSPSQGNVCTSW